MGSTKKRVRVIEDHDPMTAGKLRDMGFILIPCGIGLMFARGWYAGELIPVPWIGYFFTGVGVVVAIFATPLHNRLKRQR